MSYAVVDQKQTQAADTRPSPHVEAFFASVPELQQYFAAAVQKSPAPDDMLRSLAEGFSILAALPTERAQRTPAQQDASVDARMQIATTKHHAAKQNVLSAELGEMERIISSHLKPAP